MSDMKHGTTSGIIRPFGIALLSFCSLLLIGSTISTISKSPDRAATPCDKVSVSPSTTHFAIADFDGDRQPDLASIRVARDGVPNAEYSLDLKFSSGPQPAISILGPAGGLQITSQDVNGDEFADLVVTSLFDSHFVAILLNDGSGHFQVADRASFPEVGKRTNSVLLSPEDTIADRITLRENRSTHGEEGAQASRQKLPQHSAGKLPAPRVTVVSVLAPASAGRAPPLV